MQDKTKIKQELSEILVRYYDGSFARLVQEYIRISGISEEEREALVEIMKQTIKKIEKTASQCVQWIQPTGRHHISECKVSE